MNGRRCATRTLCHTDVVPHGRCALQARLSALPLDDVPPSPPGVRSENIVMLTRYTTIDVKIANSPLKLCAIFYNIM